MRVSCNGCRVLRKGCSEDCSIRACLEWIKNPRSQANATLFLAKFYGRAGLVNLINAGPHHLRPSIFKSLLFEACGRIVNPIDGSVGLLWSGSWQLCQNAVESVLTGTPGTPTAENKYLKVYDIRHVGKDDDINRSNEQARSRKRNRCRVGFLDESVNRSPSHGSSLSHLSEAAVPKAEKSNLPRSELTVTSDAYGDEGAADGAIQLDLTLGFEPFKRREKPTEVKRCLSIDSPEDGTESYRTGLRLD